MAVLIKRTDPTGETQGASATVQIRRARRTDFTGVMQLLATSAVPVPPPERATLRRFRNLVNDLGTDFYLALVDGALVGLVHVTYARQLSVAPLARLEQLLVVEPFRRRGIGRMLLRFGEQRARKRGCGAIVCEAAAAASGATHRFFEQAGFRPTGASWRQSLHAREP